MSIGVRKRGVRGPKNRVKRGGLKLSSTFPIMNISSNFPLQCSHNVGGF